MALPFLLLCVKTNPSNHHTGKRLAKALARPGRRFITTEKVSGGFATRNQQPAPHGQYGKKVDGEYEPP